MVKRIKESFFKSPYRSIKHSSYFNSYETLFSSFIDKKITFIEIGVLNGGSLFMWRDYLGENARIIGIDNNPKAIRWKEYGFEIFIGDQGDSNFWHSIQKEIGSIDIILDDGGHLDFQQIITLVENAKFINNGGLIVIEDTHASYKEEFGNPSKYSFINFVFNLINRINYRSGALISKLRNKHLILPISEIRIFESICAFKIDRENSFTSKIIENNGEDLKIKAFRFEDTNIKNYRSLIYRFSFLKKIFFLGTFINYIYINFFRNKLHMIFLRLDRKKKIKKYFFKKI
jgi:hypothetical protein